MIIASICTPTLTVTIYIGRKQHFVTDKHVPIAQFIIWHHESDSFENILVTKRLERSGIVDMLKVLSDKNVDSEL